MDKMRKVSEVICDGKLAIKFKGRFYHTTICPTILYGSEYWTMREQHETGGNSRNKNVMMDV